MAEPLAEAIAKLDRARLNDLIAELGPAVEAAIRAALSRLRVREAVARHERKTRA